MVGENSFMSSINSEKDIATGDVAKSLNTVIDLSLVFNSNNFLKLMVYPQIDANQLFNRNCPIHKVFNLSGLNSVNGIVHFFGDGADFIIVDNHIVTFVQKFSNR